MKSNEYMVISIFDLGVHAKEMLDNWLSFKHQGIKISLQEFPSIDLYQLIDDKELMEFVLELFLLLEKKKKKLVKQRQAKGIEEARKKGIRIGRRPKKIPENFEEVYQKVKEREMTIKKATEILKVDYKTYRKWIKE